MDKETFIEKIKEAGTCEDIIKVRGILAEIQDEVSKVYDDSLTMSDTLKKSEEEKETLRQANMDLFLRVGSNKTPQEVQENETGIHTEPKKEYKSYDDLAKEFIK